MFGVTRDALELILRCLNGEATAEECAIAKEYVADLLARALESDDYVAFLSDFQAELDVEELMLHEEAIQRLSEIYQLSEELIEALIDDYFDFLEGGMV